ncbi:MAG TPA: hypothetical protein VN446_06650 [Candidatus Acidoferrum sp.]|nr:hypothetical protein [Candidatus Acidoferrum sp.]
MEKAKFLYLSQGDVMGLEIGWPDIIATVEAACAEEARGTLQCPPKRELLPRPGSTLVGMPAELSGMDACGIKWVSSYPENIAAGLPQVAGLQVMNHPDTGLPMAVMDCRWLTAVRTAAATAVTAEFCAKKGAATVAIVGGGVQGHMHLVALRQVLGSLTRCNLVELREETATDYKRKMEELTGVEVALCGSVGEAMAGADIVVTCTQRVQEPLIPAEHFLPGMLGVGLEAARAWPGALLHGVDKVVTDYPEQTVTYEGTGAFEGGVPPIYASLGQLVLRDKPGREQAGERILAFNLGFGGVDIAMGKLIYEKALSRGAGTWLTLMESQELF